MGTVQVLSDRMVRSEIYGLIVDVLYRGNGIGTELVRRCRGHFPDSERTLQTTEKNVGYYEKLGFSVFSEVYMRLPSKYF